MFGMSISIDVMFCPQSRDQELKVSWTHNSSFGIFMSKKSWLEMCQFSEIKESTVSQDIKSHFEKDKTFFAEREYLLCCTQEDSIFLVVEREQNPLSWIEASHLCQSLDKSLPSVLDQPSLLSLVQLVFAECAPLSAALFVGLFLNNQVNNHSEWKSCQITENSSSRRSCQNVCCFRQTGSGSQRIL